MLDSKKFSIYYDAYQEGIWFQKLNPILASATMKKIEKKGGNPKNIESAIEYDRPDIILDYGDETILVIERTEEVPSGHNVGQRFARVVKASELKIPVIYFFPFQAQKHGKETLARKAINKTNLRFTNLRLFNAFNKIQAIHQSLVLSINWQLDNNFELLRNTKKDKDIKIFLEEYFKIFQNKPKINELNNLNSVQKGIKEISDFIISRAKNSQLYQKPPSSVTIIDTSIFLKKLNIGEPLHSQLCSRKKTLIYKIGMNYIRSDPYTGMLLFYDYLYSRTGKKENQRDMNIVCHMPEIKIGEWNRITSANKNRKDISIYSRFSDLILLKDGIIG